MLQWLHLSDFHFSYDNHINKNIRNTLIEHLTSLDIKIDAIFITGDIAYKEIYPTDLKLYLERISEVTKCKWENIFICVGNHDIKRNPYRTGNVEIAIKNYHLKNEELCEDDYEQLFNMGHKKYIDKIKEILPHLSTEVHSFEEREKYTVTILNTCLFSSGDDDKGKLCILDNKFYNVLNMNKSVREKNKINFAIGHHSEDWLEGKQQKSFGTYLEKNGVDLYLCGHNHDFNIKELNDSNIRQCTVGSILEINNDSVCFILGEFNAELIEYKIQIHSCNTENGCWYLDKSYNKFQNGVFTEKLLRDNNLIDKSVENTIKLNCKSNSLEYEIMMSGIKQKSLEFIGYETELEEIKERINKILENQDYGELLFYYARELYGKSYFCAKLIYDLLYSDKALDKNLIFIDGKRTNNIAATLEMLRKQASDIIGYEIKYENDLQKNEEDYLNISEMKKFEQVVHILSKNNKKVLIVIDALNEINSQATDFIPRFLPPNICCLITSNLENKKFQNRYELKGFKEKEIKSILENNNDKYIRKVMKITKGCPTLIFDVADSLKDVNGDIKRAKIKGSGKEYFTNKIIEWQHNKILTKLLDVFSMFGYVSSLSLDQLYAYLCEDQSFKDITGKQILNALENVKNQLLISNELGETSYKAYFSLFVDQINMEKTKKELAACIESTMNCMINNFELFDATILRKFFNYWISYEDLVDQNKVFLMKIPQTLWTKDKVDELEEIAIELLMNINNINCNILRYFEENCDKINSEIIYRILCHLYSEKDSKYKSDEKLLALLERLYLYNTYEWAQLGLAIELLNKNESEKRHRGEMLLREAAETGNLSAKNILGWRLLDGNNLKQNKEEGEKILREAAEAGSDSAKIILGNRLLDGNNIAQNKQEGEQLLREAAKSGSNSAKKDLGNRLLDGDNIVQNKEDGERLLREAVEAGYLEAKHDLANRLLDGDNIVQNKEDGERLLREAAKAGNLGAKHDLANRLLDGDNVAQNKADGERLLREAEKAGNLDSKLDLGNRLLDGDNIVQNKEDGKRLLSEAAEAGSISAKRTLGNRLLDGKNVVQNKEDGEQLLREAAESGNNSAKRDLGNRLLDGDNIVQNKEDGERLLREAVEAGSISAKRNLANRLLDGDNIAQNREEGERLLREAVETGYLDAKNDLGNRLLDGDNIVQNKEEGERLLREAISVGDDDSKNNLGNRLLDGDNIIQNKEEGERLLREAVEAGNLIAKYNLAIRLLDGDNIPQNKKEGELLLREVAKTGALTAKYSLGIRLLDGDNIVQNKKEGERLLREATEAGYADAINALAYFLYENNNKEEAIKLYCQGIQKGNSLSEINLAYLIRRGEYKGHTLDEAKKLLKKYVYLDSPDITAIINYALCIIHGSSSVIEWRKAEEVLLNLKDINETEIQKQIKWWIDLSREGDLEGDLVIGWLTKLDIIGEIDGLRSADRIKKVLDADIFVIDWLYK